MTCYRIQESEMPTHRTMIRYDTPFHLLAGACELEDAERLLKEGKADLIGVGRALLKDPCRRG